MVLASPDPLLTPPPSSSSGSRSPYQVLLYCHWNLTLALSMWWRWLWAGSGCVGSGRAPGWVFSIFCFCKKIKRHHHLDGLCRLCCGVAVGRPFAGGRPSVFRSQSLLVRWGDAWGCGGGRTAAWESSGRGQLQQVCRFTAV